MLGGGSIHSHHVIVTLGKLSFILAPIQEFTHSLPSKPPSPCHCPTCRPHTALLSCFTQGPEILNARLHLHHGSAHGEEAREGGGTRRGWAGVILPGLVPQHPPWNHLSCFSCCLPRVGKTPCEQGASVMRTHWWRGRDSGPGKSSPPSGLCVREDSSTAQRHPGACAMRSPTVEACGEVGRARPPLQQGSISPRSPCACVPATINAGIPRESPGSRSYSLWRVPSRGKAGATTDKVPGAEAWASQCPRVAL